MLIDIAFRTSDEIQNGRTTKDVLTHATSELGELAQEIIISEGRSYKDPGADGVVGEAIDMMLCMLDIIRLERPDLTEEDLVEIAEAKAAKWKAKAHRPMPED